MARFKQTDSTQGLFLTVNLREQLLPGTFEWTINYLIDKVDTGAFEKNYKNEKLGAAAYSPRILLKVILYCYSKGIITSRKIEKACRENIIAKALAEELEPDHDTIATFITSNNESVKELFTQVVLQCSQLGLISGEMFAMDGCKLPSNASKEWSGTIKDLTKKRDKLKEYIARMIKTHKELDNSKEAKERLNNFRQTMGEDKERREKNIERLEKRLKKLNTFLETAKPRIGAMGKEVQSNITDNESGRILGSHGYIQGYNGIAMADSANQVIICADVIGSASESTKLPKMLGLLEDNMKKVTGKKKPLENAIVEADTGYFSEENLSEAIKRNIEVLIPDNQFRKRDSHFDGTKGRKEKKRFSIEDFNYDKKTDCFTCPAGKTLAHSSRITLRKNTGKQYRAKVADCRNCILADKCINKRGSKRDPLRSLYIVDKKHEKNLSNKMREKIDKPVNRELYSRRMQIIEPVFSHITYLKGMDRFMLRGERKVKVQWLLYCIVHNMWKCIVPLAERSNNL